MAKDSAIFDRCGSFADEDRVLDLAEPVALEAGVLGAADGALGPQRLKEFLPKHAAGLNERAALVVKI